MASEEDYLEINRASWNKRVDSHYKSDFYAVNAFIAGKSSLNPIEVELLPNLQGKRVLHLQCHFGQDSLSLARLGAKAVYKIGKKFLSKIFGSFLLIVSIRSFVEYLSII